MIALWPFYFVTMEQYYTGEMNFPPINGVDEGSIVITGLSFVSAYYGNVEFWTQQVDVPGDWKNSIESGTSKHRYLCDLRLRTVRLGEHLQRHTSCPLQSNLQAPIFRCTNFLLFLQRLHLDYDATIQPY